MRNTILRSSLTIAIAAVLSIGGAGAGQAQKLDKLTVAGWSQPISEITNLLAEPDKGFFKARGIDLSYAPGAGGGDAVRNMLTGRADVAFTDPGSFFAAIDKGAKLKAIYNIYPQNVFNVVALKSSGITKPSDLKGKTIGVYSLSSGTRQNLQVLLHQVGLSEADVTIQVTGLLNFAPVMQGQVDATAATDTGLYVGKLKGLKNFNVIEVRNYLNVPSDLFVVTEETFQKRKDVLRRFLASYRDSATWMINNPKQAAKIAMKRTINGKNEAVNLAIIKIRNISTVSKTTKKRGLGHFDLDLLQKGVATYRKLGLIKKDIDVSKVVTSELIPK
ncbi:MAG: ABC transporter substrate-binding protein [Alphaproteobacteria bacterium]